MSSKDILYSTKEMDLTSCVFLDPKVIDGYQKSIMKINNNEGGVILQTPRLSLRNDNKESVELLINKNREKSREFYNLLSCLEDMAVSTIVQNSSNWFGRKIKRDAIDDTFRSCLRCPLDIDDPFILKLRKQKSLTLEPEYQVICLVKIEGIVFGNSSCKLGLSVVNAKTIKPGDSQERMESVTYFPDGQSVTNNIFGSYDPQVAEEAVPRSVAGSVVGSVSERKTESLKNSDDVKNEGVKEEKPVEEKPVEEKPAEEKPAEEKPAEEKPVLHPDTATPTEMSLEDAKREYMKASLKNDTKSMNSVKNFLEKSSESQGVYGADENYEVEDEDGYDIE